MSLLSWIVECTPTRATAWYSDERAVYIALCEAHCTPGGRAEALLVRNLTQAEFDEYRMTHSFTVRGKRNTYRIHNAPAYCHALVTVEGSPYLKRFCVSVRDIVVPMADQMLTMKWRIQCDEDGFLRTANLY